MHNTKHNATLARTSYFALYRTPVPTHAIALPYTQKQHTRKNAIFGTVFDRVKHLSQIHYFSQK
jgi:hypothetical protein